jgi:hypothetical protein
VSNLNETIAFYSFGALVGLVAFVRRVRNNGFKLNAKNRAFVGTATTIQAAMSPLTLVLELMLALPRQFNLFQVASTPFQKSLLHDGSLILDLACFRILIGLLIVTILSVGALSDVESKIGVPYIAIHLTDAFIFMRVAIALAGSPGVSGQFFESPAFLHFAVALAHSLNFVRNFQHQVRQEFEASGKDGTRLKQE